MKHDLTKSNDPSNIRPPSYSLHHLGTSRPATIAIFSLSSFDAQVVSRRLNSYGKFYPGIPLLCLTSLETNYHESSLKEVNFYRIVRLTRVVGLYSFSLYSLIRRLFQTFPNVAVCLGPRAMANRSFGVLSIPDKSTANPAASDVIS